MKCLDCSGRRACGSGCGDFAVFEGVGAGHHVDGVDEELRGDASFFFVLAEAEESDAGDYHYGRIGVAQLGRIGSGPLFVVFLVVGAIFDNLRLNAGLESSEILFRGIPIEKQRADAGAQEMIGATGADSAQLA